MKRQLISLLGIVTTFFAPLSLATPGWQLLDKSNLNGVLSQPDAQGVIMASRVNGVQVIAFFPTQAKSVVIGQLSERKDKNQRWALSSGKPEGEELRSAEGLEAGAYRELREEFGIPENLGTKTDKVLLNDAGKYGVKLVFFFALDQQVTPELMRNTIETEIATCVGGQCQTPEYVDWKQIPLDAFESDLSGKTQHFQWRTFDKTMFGTPVGLALVRAAIYSHQ